MKSATTLEKLARRSYDSYLARLHAQRRLHALDHWWAAAGYSSGAAILAVSIAFLGNSGSPSTSALPAASVLLAIASLVALIVTILIAQLNLAARAEQMFRNYRQLQKLSVEVESLMDGGARVKPRELAGLQRDYQALLDETENHRTVDHAIAKANGRVLSLPLGMVLAYIRSFVIPGVIVCLAAAATIWVIAYTLLSGLR
jgi:hypothetical protein